MEEHPVFPQLVWRYQQARVVYRDAEVRGLAQRFGMTEREYADRYIAMNFAPLMWTGVSTGNQDLTAAPYDAAFEAATTATPTSPATVGETVEDKNDTSA